MVTPARLELTANGLIDSDEPDTNIMVTTVMEVIKVVLHFSGIEEDFDVYWLKEEKAQKLKDRLK